ncbi:MAG TPA: hypothetical protein VI072_18295, partial [Polyangiaceae bacterium]
AIRCDADDYPLPPTFCDDWCRVIRRVPCDEEPENCVRTCERSRGPAQCQQAYRVLLGCYAGTPASEFSCSDEGFNEVARPNEHICRTERDTLIECAYPNVRACLDVCRTLEDAHQQDASAGSSRVRCPSRDVPCDSLCWYVTREITAIIRDAGASDANDGGVFRDVASALITCAIERADACRAAAHGDALDGSADASDDAAPANWSSVLLRCAGQVRPGGGGVP